MGSCFSRRKRSDAAVIHNASPRSSHDFAPAEPLAKDSPLDLLHTDPRRIAKDARSSLKKSASRPPPAPAQGTSRFSEEKQRAEFSSSPPATAFSEVAPACNSTLSEDINGALPPRSVTDDSPLAAPMAVVTSPSSNHALPEPRASPAEASLSPVSHAVEDGPPSSTGISKHSTHQASTVVFPDIVNRRFRESDPLGDPPDGIKCIHPTALGSNLKKSCSRGRSASEGFAALNLEVRCKHMLSGEAQEAQGEPVPKLKRSRSCEHHMDVDARGLLRRRSFLGIEESTIPEVHSVEGCRDCDSDSVPSVAVEHPHPSSEGQRRAYSGGFGGSDTEEKAADRNIDDEDGSLAEAFGEVVSSKAEITGQGRTTVNFSPERGRKYEENGLAADFFEMKERYLSSFSTAAATLKDDGSGREDEDGVAVVEFAMHSSEDGEDEEEEEFHDITDGVSLASYADEQARSSAQKELRGGAQWDDDASSFAAEKKDEMRKSFASMHSRAASMDSLALETTSSNGLLLCAKQGAAQRDYSGEEEEECESDSETFEFKQAVSVFSPENMQSLGRTKERRKPQLHRQQQQQCLSQPQRIVHQQRKEATEQGDSGRFRELSGDAKLFSGPNSGEFHLIPSSFVQSNANSVVVSSKSAPQQQQQQQQPQQSTTLSIDDIILLLESEELDEDDLLSFLINAKAASCPASDVASESSFEFKVVSSGSTPHSTPSTPMLSAGSTPRRISQLKPIALTPEEIAEIWGVFEQRQATASS